MKCNSNATRLIAAFLLGAVSVGAFAPFGWFPLIWLTQAGLYTLLCYSSGKTNSARRGALIGGVYGFGFFISGVSWVFVSLNKFGGMPLPLAALLTALFCAYLSLYPALAGAVFSRKAPAQRGLRALFFAASMTLGEVLRGWIFTGFPWLTAGYSQTPPSPLAGYLPLLGVFGVSFLTMTCGALIAECLRNRSWRQRLEPAVATLLFIGLGSLLGQMRWTTPSGTPLTVALLQGNIAQDAKWRPEKFTESLNTYFHLARDNPAQLTVLPETALPAFLAYIPTEYLDALRQLAARENGNVVLGTVVGSDDRYANGAISFGQDTRQIYRKSHLVPFGEFIPPGFSWFLRVARIPMSSFTPGEARQPPMQLSGQRVAINICYEDVFGAEIIRALPEATLLINLSNVAWFGDSLAPAQHLQIARVRALEAGRMMLRATNTGETAIVDVDGRVLSRLTPFTRDALRGTVQGYTGSTPFVQFSNWPVIILSLLLVAIRFSRRKAFS